MDNYAATRAERLDELPVTRKHTRLLGVSGIGWALDAMDVGLISFIMAALAVQWNLTKTEVSWLGSIGFVGMALGATFGGLLADKFGRRQVFAATLLIYGIATGASALAGSLIVLMALRFFVGLGLGPSCQWHRPSSRNFRRAPFAVARWCCWRRSGRSVGFCRL